MPTLAEIRARLAAQDAKNSNQGSADKSIFPFWNINENESTVLRLLPDGNKSNTFFWAERAMIRLPFSGSKSSDGRPVIVTVPCMEMWGDVCPVLTEIRPWYKDESMKTMAGKYWKKRSYFMQGFVRENPLEKDDETPENPIRKFIISPQVYAIIKGALLDPDLEELPTDFEKGLDFRIVKTKKGEHADYATSKWSRKESALTAIEREAIDKFGLYDLSSFLPKKPGPAEVNAIREMFEASVNGEAYDLARWGQYFKPSGGFSSNDEENIAPKQTSAAANENHSDDEGEAPAPAPTPAAGSQSTKANDILAMIRNRQKIS